MYPQPVIDSELRNRCWNDKKWMLIMAIIPTVRVCKVNLTQDELNVYGLVVRQYLMQFYPDAIFRKCVIELGIAGGKFIAKERLLAESGGHALLGSKEQRDEENEGGNHCRVVVKRILHCYANEV